MILLVQILSLLSQVVCITSTSTSNPISLTEWRNTNIFQCITSAQWEKLSLLHEKVYEWNTKVNIISRKDIDMLVPSHIIPSLAILKVRHFNHDESVIDIGTGGGFPGLPLAVTCPNAYFTLVDSNGKKVSVVQDIANSLGLSNVKVLHARAETITEKYDFLLGRAVSNIPNFLSFSSHLMTSSSKSEYTKVSKYNTNIRTGLLYIKGGDYIDELAAGGIGECSSFSIKTLVDEQLESDKNVLYIPAKEILAFHSRLLETQRLAALAGKKKPKL